MQSVKFLLHHRICEVLAVLMAVFFFSTKDLSKPYDKVIMAEGLGYYAYLPAVYIYNDLSFSFFNQVHEKYYATGYKPPTRNFIVEYDGIRLNKYFPGVSLLWLPFFLAAHLLALLFRLPADGYSPVYQYAIGMAGIFYTWLGLVFTRKLLSRFGIVPAVQWVVLAGIVFATNMLLYSASWSAQTHAYSFCLIAALCWVIASLATPDDYTSRKLGIIFLLLALIVTIRPQNIIILALTPFLGLNISAMPRLFTQLFTRKAMVGLLLAVLVVARVCYYWYLQTGHVFLQPYHGEGYFFDKPHVMDMLFSYRKGWVLYSPFVIFGLAGIFFAPDRISRLNLFIFWSAEIYISSCWWCWTYSPSSFGQRPFVDFYCLIALQAAFLFQYLYERNRKAVIVFPLAILVPLNLLQVYQYRNGIIPGEFGSAETYWGNFLAVRPIAYYAVPPQTIIDKKELLVSYDDTLNSNRVTGHSFSGFASTFVSAEHPYSENARPSIPSFMKPGLHSHVRVTARIRSSPSVAGHESLVIDFKRKGETVSYQGFNLGDYARGGKWITMQFGVEYPEAAKEADSLLIYLWRQEKGGFDTTWMDDLHVEFLLTDDSFDFHRKE